MSNKDTAPNDGYEVGYGKPPMNRRFKKGQSGNRWGRPKGSKNKRSKKYDERLRKIVLEEAYRKIPVSEGGEQIEIYMIQAMVRTVAVDAVKGNPRAQKLLADMVKTAEAAKAEEEDDQININISFGGPDE